MWDYTITGKADERRPDKWHGKILVPYPIESALSGVMKPLGPDQRLWYHRRFAVPQQWAGQRVLLHFGAVNWQTTVLLNGRELGGHRGGYDAFTWSNPLPLRYTEGQTAPRTELRDPCVIREGDTYYLVFTMWPFRNREPNRLDQPNQGGSPGIALYSSPDLKQWKFEKWLVKSSELPEIEPTASSVSTLSIWTPRDESNVGSLASADNP